MYTAADLILALQRRLQLMSPHLRRPPGEFPPGWQAWLAAMSTRVGAVTGATAQSILDVFLARPLADRPRRTGELTRWQAFGTLWRQEWQGPVPEDRRTHLVASGITLLWHLVLGALVMWLFVMRLFDLPDEASQRRGDDVVQVEYIGQGTPEEVGGGQSGEPVPAPEAQQAPAAVSAEPAPPEALEMPAMAQAEPSPSEPALAVPTAPVEAREIPEPVPAPIPPPVEQNVEVSAPTPEPTEFVLQAPTPQLRPREVSPRDVQAPAVTVRDVAEPLRVPTREVQQRPAAAQAIQSRVPDVTVREIGEPLPQVRQPQLTAPMTRAPAVRMPDTAVRTREVPAPRAPTVAAQGTSPAAPATSASPASSAAPATAAPAAAAPSTAPAAAAASAASAQPASTAPAAASRTAPAAAPPGSRTAASTPGQGPRPISAPGAFPTAPKSDDWGASTRNAPGGQQGEPSGRYDTSGGPHLTESPINPGQPPGTIDDRIVDLDRSGTWLKRKPVGYEPTSLDKYWRPNETLLQEWVRRGVKRMSIPIPGTSKKIECIVSILALGGGCGISDPNLNDQPARARPPPTVPFKPHLQEDNGSVKPAPTPAG